MTKQSGFLKTIHNISNAVSSGGVQNWIYRGTLLSAVRENTLLSHAQRFHLCYMENEDTDITYNTIKLIEILKNIVSIHGLSISPIEKMKKGSKYTVGFKLTGGPIDIVFQECKKENSDLILKMNPGLNYKYYFVDELEDIMIDGWKFPCPRYAKKLCALLYGYQWQESITRENYYKTALRKGKLQNLGPTENKITGYAEGVFDLFHIGHLNLLKRGKMLYDRLLVGVQTDEGVTYKRKPLIPYEQRLEIIKACKYVDGVIERPPNAMCPYFLEKKRSLAFYEQHNIDYELAGRSSEEYFVNFYSDIMDCDKLHLVSRTENISVTEIVRKIKQ